MSETTNTNTDSRTMDDAMHKNTYDDTSESDVKHSEQEQLSVSVKSNTRRRGRPRKTENDCANVSTSKKLEVDETLGEIPSTSTETTSRSKRRASRVAVDHDINGLSDESDIAQTVENEPLVEKQSSKSRGRTHRRGRGRGRGRGRAQDSSDTEYTPKTSEKRDASRSKGVKNESSLDSTAAVAEFAVVNTEDAVTPDSGAQNIEKDIHMVTCSKCKQHVPRKQWPSHNVYRHNNMAWRQGEAKLDFDNDIKLLRKVLACAVKTKRNLTCEDCGVVKLSANGFISHIKFCGKTEEERQALMMTCPICNSVMMPSSMEMHERWHRQSERNKNKEVSVVLTEKVKRKAAEKAIPKIQQFAESMREQNPCATRIKLESATLKNAIQTPELKKKIPSVWKGIWRKELASQGIVSCKQIGCTYTCSSYESICEHYSHCNFIPQRNYMCKICKFLADSRDKIANHITESHTSEENFEKDSDFERDEINSSDDSIIEYDTKRKNRSIKLTQVSSDSTRTSNKASFLGREPVQRPQSTKTYRPALNWTMTFESENFELDLFQDYMPNVFTLLRDNDAAKYLPELTSSMAIKCVNVNSSENTEDSVSGNWKRMNRFEGSICGDVPTFFAGGPIWASAWLPIPLSMYAKIPTQYVAISTHPTMGSEYAVGKSYSESNVIQIWDVGLLDHESNSRNRPPILAYAIAHNSGTVWCLEWCPSGCYQDIDLCNYKAEKGKLRRMGLLAAACSDGCINIYSLPFADELGFERAEHNSWPIYKTEPVATLVVNLSMCDNNKQNWQCSKLSWTREHGHDVIAAGLTNGYIALWDLTTTSPLLLNVRKDTKFIDAYQHFFAHHNAVSMVALVPYHGKRYLASASVDRTYKFWDLEETSMPQNCSKKGIIVDGAWMTHWPCSVISFDDALGFNCTHSYVIPLREHGYKYCPILATNSSTYTITVSDYANGIAHGTLAGEILTIFPHQLLYTDKFLSRKRQLNSVVRTIDFLKEQRNLSSENNDDKNDKTCKDYHYMPANYHECKDRFGIIFHDNLTNLKGNIKTDKQQDILYNEKLTPVPIEQHPFTSVNRVIWNPNAWSYLWLMVSYQNGLTRLLNFKSMSAPREMNILLSSHAKSSLAKTNPSAQESL